MRREVIRVELEYPAGCPFDALDFVRDDATFTRTDVERDVQRRPLRSTAWHARTLSVTRLESDQPTLESIADVESVAPDVWLET